MSRFATGDVVRLCFVTFVVAGAIAAYPLYLPWGSAESRPANEPEVKTAQIQALMARLDRAEQQVRRMDQIQKAQESQDQTIALLKTQQERTSDWIAATSRQIADVSQYASSGDQVARRELEELKQAVSLSQQQIGRLRGTVSGDLRRMSNDNKAIGVRLARLQKSAEEQRNAEQRRSKSSKRRRAH